MNSGSGFCFTPDQPVSPPAPENPFPSFDTNKRPFDTAFHPPAPTTFGGPPPPPPASSYQPGWTNNRGGYSNTFRGGFRGGYNQFPKRSRPYNYQN